jgi:hypothetical protein
MPKPNTFVSGIDRLDPPVDGPARELLDTFVGSLHVYFDNLQAARLDSADPQFELYADTLAELQRQRLSVYVEINPHDRTIAAVEIPVPGKVVALSRDSSGEVTFRLDNSAKFFTLKPENPDSRNWLHVLHESQIDGTTILVTETEIEPEIVDIRRMENPPAPALLPTARVEPALRPAVIRPVTPERAMALFEMVAARSCRPLTPAAPCIPFLYPRDGCHARAHEMCRLIIEAGEQPAKVWNYSDLLVVKTANEPTCEATWGFHVAVTLDVQTAGGAESQTQVIDPSLFSEPVPVAIWQCAQGDPNSILAFTSPNPFLPPKPADVETDPTNSKTNKALVIYRSKLKLRSARIGPPPYRKCLGNRVL